MEFLKENIKVLIKSNLYLVTKERGFNSNEWLTFEQAQKAGYVIKEEEHGTPVFNHKLIEAEGKKQKSVEILFSIQ